MSNTTYPLDHHYVYHVAHDPFANRILANGLDPAISLTHLEEITDEFNYSIQRNNFINRLLEVFRPADTNITEIPKRTESIYLFSRYADALSYAAENQTIIAVERDALTDHPLGRVPRTPLCTLKNTVLGYSGQYTDFHAGPKSTIDLTELPQPVSDYLKTLWKDISKARHTDRAHAIELWTDSAIPKTALTNLTSAETSQNPPPKYLKPPTGKQDLFTQVSRKTVRNAIRKAMPEYNPVVHPDDIERIYLTGPFATGDGHQHSPGPKFCLSSTIRDDVDKICNNTQTKSIEEYRSGIRQFVAATQLSLYKSLRTHVNGIRPPEIIVNDINYTHQELLIDGLRRNKPDTYAINIVTGERITIPQATDQLEDHSLYSQATAKHLDTPNDVISVEEKFSFCKEQIDEFIKLAKQEPTTSNQE